jgi:hypothetical protein
MLTIGSLIDWVLIGILAAPFIAVVLVTSFTDVRRGQRGEREAARMRHPSSLRSIETKRATTDVPKDVPKAA